MASTVTATHRAAPESPREQACEVLKALAYARERTLGLVGHVSDRDLMRVHSPIMSPLAWDLGHVAAYEDLWLAHRQAGLELLRGELASVYDAFETPRAVRADAAILGPGEARAYMGEVRERSVERVLRQGVGEGEGEVYEMVIRHELQHSETMRQTMAIAGLLPGGEPPFGAPCSAREGPAAMARDAAEPATEWVEVPAGAFAMGAGEQGFAYDNERPRHTVELPGFRIASRPVSNAQWARFAEGTVQGDPDAPVCHVSWFQASEYARAAGARLPSEAEWERAAAGGLLADIGRVWEWTGSVFSGYPGFVAHPYREYSEVFFDRGYRVLRGGSWATDERVKTLTFRNWDLPQRSQIFAGVRLARDVS